MSDEFNEALNAQDPQQAGQDVTSTTPLLGTVVAAQANYYQVQLDLKLDISSHGTQVNGQEFNANDKAEVDRPALGLLCTRRSRLKKIGQRVMVGDRVEVEEPDWAGGRGAIAQVLPRRSELDRPPVSNADQLLLVFALVEPTLDPHQLSRFLVKAESTGLQVCLGLNKCDIATEDEREHWQTRLQQWGYTPLLMSVYKEKGLVALERQLRDRVTIVSGPSGVGKSSLINQLIPHSDLRVSAVSGKLGRGRHTTRHVELFALPMGGLLADTPGFNQPDLNCMPEDLANYFPEAQARLRVARCQFSDCLHQDEPSCVVRGEWERYEHYLAFLADAIAHQDALNKLGGSEATLKRKSNREGGDQYEPKLETKKYRRPSRRVQQQTLQGMRHDLKDASLDGD